MPDDELQETVQEIRQRSENVREYALTINARIQNIDKRNLTVRKHSFAMNEQIEDICQQSKKLREHIIKGSEFRKRSYILNMGKNGL